MTTQWILLSALGSVSGHHIFHRLHTLRVISQQTLGRLKLMTAPASLLLMFWLARDVNLALALVAGMQLLPPVAMAWNFFSRRRRYRARVVPFLDEVLLNMRSGRSFREALHLAGARESTVGAEDLGQIPAMVVFPESATRAALLAEAQDLLGEFREMDRSSVRVIDRLQAVRRRERTKRKFRQKSSQVTSQVKAQAAVCSLLYLALAAWTCASDPAKILTVPLILSFGLFLVGIGVMTLIGRSFKWKH